MGSMSIWHWLVVLLIIALVFGTRKIKDLGRDLGESVKGFKNALEDNKSPVDNKIPSIAEGTDETPKQPQK